jgi:adenylate cyclase
VSHAKKFRITPALTTVLGLFVLLTAGAVLVVQAVISRDVVRELGGELIDNGMDGLEAAVAEQLYAIRKTARYTARALDMGTLSFDDTDKAEQYLFGSLAPLDFVSFSLLIDADGSGLMVDRGPGDGTLLSETFSVNLDEPLVAPIFNRARSTYSSFWSKPIFLPERDNTYLLYVKPLHEADEYLGSIILGMSLYRMSDITRYLSDDDVTVFLMEVGTTEIIAHPGLNHHFADLSPDNILVDVDDVPDPFLAGFSELRQIGNRTYDLNPRDTLYSGYDENGEKRFLVLEDENRRFRGLPVRIGVHFPLGFSGALHKPAVERCAHRPWPAWDFSAGIGSPCTPDLGACQKSVRRGKGCCGLEPWEGGGLAAKHDPRTRRSFKRLQFHGRGPQGL